ncbi:hypothetical protein R1sor_023611 [Riccia sorocarpa]|uniref:Tonsoku-like protein n=1 Tax=Riccia sorocarpa TaxID=122646 RepID=A0ABD3GN50_9MARC
MGKGRKDGSLLEGMIASYKNAKNTGDEEDEAKWANNIGHLYKERGEYKLALHWFTKDYNISIKLHPSDPVKLMPTCQSIGEAHLRLIDLENALTWQIRHFKLAEEAVDEPEQQRASTQLGRTYLEIFESKNTTSAVQDASRYFGISLELAKKLKANPPPNSPTGFVKELVDAYNNLGLLRVAVDDYIEAEKYYNQGLKICDDEELNENDDARSRLHHNLGQLYCELRQWEKARYHTDMDIAICQRIPHAQGEAKGLVNQGILHLKSLEFEKARMSFKRALVIAQSLQDETQLCLDIKANLDVLDEAEEKTKQIALLMQHQKKLRRGIENAPNVLASRTMMKQEMKLLFDILTEAYAIKSWDVHLGMAKRLKYLSERLGDHEKLGDALGLIGISYYNLRNFTKAVKWHEKEWDVCNRINHLEGQIVAKINLGNCYDSYGDWESALEAYQDAYRAASSKSTPILRSQKINALENMHYCYSIRLAQFEDARKIELEMQTLINTGGQPVDDEDERCSETDGEGGEGDVNMAEDSDTEKGSRPENRNSRLIGNRLVISLDDTDEDERCAETNGQRSWEDFDMVNAGDLDLKRYTKEPRPEDSLDDNATLSSLLPAERVFPLKDLSTNIIQRKELEKKKKIPAESRNRQRDASGMDTEKEKLLTRKQQLSRRKKTQTVLSDEEENLAPSKAEKVACFPTKLDQSASGYVEDSDEDSDLMEVLASGKRSRLSTRHYPVKRVSTSSDNPSLIAGRSRRRQEEPYSSRSSSPEASRPSSHDHTSSSGVPEASNHDVRDATKRQSSAGRGYQDPAREVQCDTPVCDRGVEVEVSNRCLSLNAGAERVSCAPPETSFSEVGKGSEFLPAGSSCHVNEAISKSQLCGEIESSSHNLELLADDVPVLRRYLEECSVNGVRPNTLLMTKLQSLKVSEDEVVASACNLTDKTARPLVSALRENTTFTVLDLSHNQLGNAAVNDIQQLIKHTNQTDLGLTLDLHNNKFGAGALTQISQCPVALSRLEVLNLSGNRLTDAAGRHLFSILQRCTALATLSLESCELTTRTVSKLVSALTSNTTLAKLCIGRNGDIKGYVLQDLLHKLSTLQSFSELDLRGLELDEVALTGVSHLLRNSRSISTLNLEGTDIRNDGALLISEGFQTAATRLAKLNLSKCGFNSEPATKLCRQLMSVHTLAYLDLSCNDLGYQAALSIAEAISKGTCRLKGLNLSRCQIGTLGVISVMNSLKDNTILQELKLAGNMEGTPHSSEGYPSKRPSTPTRAHSSAFPEVQANSASCTDDHLLRKSCPADAPLVTSNEAEDSRQSIAEANLPLECSSSGRDLQEFPSFVQRNQKSVEYLSGALIGEKADESLDISSTPFDGSNPHRCLSAEGSFAPDDDQKYKEALCEDLCRRLVPLSSSATTPAPPYALPVPVEINPLEPCFPVDEVKELRDQYRVCSEPRREATNPLLYLQKLGPACGTSGDLAGTVEAGTCAAALALAVYPSCEDLSVSIRVAKGLRRLDLSDNNLDGGHVEHLYSGWSAVPRGNSLHQKHAEGSIVHFFVKDLPCECACPPCCGAWSAA